MVSAPCKGCLLLKIVAFWQWCVELVFGAYIVEDAPEKFTDDLAGISSMRVCCKLALRSLSESFIQSSRFHQHSQVFNLIVLADRSETPYRIKLILHRNTGGSTM